MSLNSNLRRSNFSLITSNMQSTSCPIPYDGPSTDYSPLCFHCCPSQSLFHVRLFGGVYMKKYKRLSSLFTRVARMTVISVDEV